MSSISPCVQIKLYIEKTGLMLRFRFASLLPNTPMKREESKYTQLFECLHFKVRSPKDRLYIPEIRLASVLTECPHSYRICLWLKACLQIITSNVSRIASSYCIKYNLDPQHLQKTPSCNFLEPSYCWVPGNAPGEDRLPRGERK